MGGKMSRPLPRCLPFRIVLIKVVWVHAPMPVAESGVRLAVYEIPHGPTKVVRSGARYIQLPGWVGFVSKGGKGSLAGCPDKSLVESSTGPRLVMIFGE